jgi:hypothetical protein
MNLFIAPFVNALFACYYLVGNFGWAIVLVTAVLKLILFPLIWPSLKSANKTREVQPKLNKLKEHYSTEIQENNLKRLDKEIEKLKNAIDEIFEIKSKIKDVKSTQENIDLNNVNILKLILNINEDEIYKYYPSRKNNVYAKSVKKIIPYKEYDFSNIPISIVKNNMKLPNDKYYGINFLNIVKNKKFQRLVL